MKIKAKENGYLTQVGEVADNERVYCTEVLTAEADEWREASEEEYMEWKARMEVLEDVINNELLNTEEYDT